MLPLRPKCLLSKIIKSQNHGTVISSHVLLPFLWRFDPIQSHGVLLDTPQSVGLLWTGHRSDAETYTWHFTTLRGNTSKPPTGFEPAIPASERPQNNALREVSGIDAWCSATYWCLSAPVTLTENTGCGYSRRSERVSHLGLRRMR